MKRHLTLALIAALALTVTVGGCDFTDAKQKADDYAVTVQEFSDRTAPQAEDVLDRAAPVVDALDTATGQAVPDDRLARIEHGIQTTQGIVSKLQAIAATGAALPGPQQPVAGGAAAVLGLIGTVVGVVAGIVQTLRKKRSDKAVRQLVTGVQAAKAAVDGYQNDKINAALKSVQDEDVQRAVKRIKADA